MPELSTTAEDCATDEYNWPTAPILTYQQDMTY